MTKAIERDRRRLRSATLVLALLLVFTTGAGRALEIAVGVGDYDVEEHLGDGPVEVDLVFRLDQHEMWSWEKQRVVVLPAFGALATEKETYYAWVGNSIVISFGKHWELIPELGAGYYEQGDGKNLGGEIEFRSGLAVTYRVNDGLHFGAGFYHLSNAGIYELNPGLNSLLFTVGFKP
jgi:hypothetical protein